MNIFGSLKIDVGFLVIPVHNFIQWQQQKWSNIINSLNVLNDSIRLTRKQAEQIIPGLFNIHWI